MACCPHCALVRDLLDDCSIISQTETQHSGLPVVITLAQNHGEGSMPVNVPTSSSPSAATEVDPAVHAPILHDINNNWILVEIAVSNGAKEAGEGFDGQSSGELTLWARFQQHALASTMPGSAQTSTRVTIRLPVRQPSHQTGTDGGSLVPQPQAHGERMLVTTRSSTKSISLTRSLTKSPSLTKTAKKSKSPSKSCSLTRSNTKSPTLTRSSELLLLHYFRLCCSICLDSTAL